MTASDLHNPIPPVNLVNWRHRLTRSIDCPLYTPSTTSSAVIETTSSEIITSSTVPNATTTASTLSTYYPTGNSTSHTGPTSYPNATLSYTSKAPSTTPTDLNPTQPSATGEPTEPPSSGAGLASVQSGLLVGVLGLGAAFLA